MSPRRPVGARSVERVPAVVEQRWNGYALFGAAGGPYADEDALVAYAAALSIMRIRTRTS